MPRADDFCFFELANNPTLTDKNPLGVKGVGEAGTLGAIPAVMNAVNDALARGRGRAGRDPGDLGKAVASRSLSGEPDRRRCGRRLIVVRSDRHEICGRLPMSDKIAWTIMEAGDVAAQCMVYRRVGGRARRRAAGAPDLRRAYRLVSRRRRPRGGIGRPLLPSRRAAAMGERGRGGDPVRLSRPRL